MSSDFDDLDVAMARPESAPAPANDVSVLDDAVLDSIAENSSYSGATGLMATGTGLIQPKAISGELIDAQEVVVAGVSYPLETVLELDHTLVNDVFSGNLRNRAKLKNVQDLADKIIAAGKNTEPVRWRLNAVRDGFELVTGNRRTAAFALALEQTDKQLIYQVIISDLDDTEAVIVAAMENLGKESLDPWEQADVLQRLLDEKIVEKVQDLIPYLPYDKKNITREAVYPYLYPAKIPGSVRQFIDVNLPVTNAQISKLKTVLDKGIPISLAELEGRMKESFKKGRHAVSEVLRYLSDEVIQKTKVADIKRELSPLSGSALGKVSFNVTKTGKFKGEFDKALTPDEVAEALEIGLKALLDRK